MNIRTLTYFVAVVEEGSISRAALRLRVAQPALSLHILNLERELDTELLHRTARGVTATESGTRLFEHAQDILGRMERAREDIRGYAAAPVGEAVIIMTQSIAKVLALPLFKSVQEKLPRVALRFGEVGTGHIPAQLRQRQADLGIVFKSINDPAIHEVPLVDEDLYLIGPPSARAGKRKRTVTLEEVARLQLILPGRPHSLRELINDYVKKQRRTLNVIAEVDGVPQLKDLVMAGFGHTILTLGSVQDEVANGTLSARQIVQPVITRRVMLCRSAEIPPSRAAAAVETIVLELADKLVADGLWPGRHVARPKINKTGKKP